MPVEHEPDIERRDRSAPVNGSCDFQQAHPQRGILTLPARRLKFLEHASEHVVNVGRNSHALRTPPHDVLDIRVKEAERVGRPRLVTHVRRRLGRRVRGVVATEEMHARRVGPQRQACGGRRRVRAEDHRVLCRRVRYESGGSVRGDTSCARVRPSWPNEAHTDTADGRKKAGERCALPRARVHGRSALRRGVTRIRPRTATHRSASRHTGHSSKRGAQRLCFVVVEDRHGARPRALRLRVVERAARGPERGPQCLLLGLAYLRDAPRHRRQARHVVLPRERVEVPIEQLRRLGVLEPRPGRAFNRASHVVQPVRVAQFVVRVTVVLRNRRRRVGHGRARASRPPRRGQGRRRDNRRHAEARARVRRRQSLPGGQRRAGGAAPTGVLRGQRASAPPRGGRAAGALPVEVGDLAVEALAEPLAVDVGQVRRGAVDVAIDVLPR